MSPDNRNNGRPAWDEAATATASSAETTTRLGGDSRSRASSDEEQLQPGTMIGDRYRIVAMLGRGGMGEVYRADDLTLGASVALKFLPVRFASDPVRLEQLRAEVRAARQVSHPNVCRVYDIDDADGRSFLIMEHIDGGDLASLLKRIGRLPREKAAELARQVAAGLAAVHEAGIVHRDLKPANVMIDGRGRARVTDFGLAGALTELQDAKGVVAGTPAYMAPEQHAGRDVSRRSDIYALGLVLYEIFTGKPAHTAETLAELREHHQSSSRPTSPSELVDGIDPVAERAIMHCLEPDQADRPASAMSVLAALPGGDPLAAMVRAGETPSPELVAATGRSGTISRAAAFRYLVLILGGMAVLVWLYGQVPVDEVMGGILAPQVLEHRAREILAATGHGGEPADSAWGFDTDQVAIDRLDGQLPEQRKVLLASNDRPVVRFLVPPEHHTHDTVAQ